MTKQAHLLTKEELRRRGITRYDAELLLAGGYKLPEPKPVVEKRKAAKRNIPQIASSTVSSSSCKRQNLSPQRPARSCSTDSSTGRRFNSSPLRQTRQNSQVYYREYSDSEESDTTNSIDSEADVKRLRGYSSRNGLSRSWHGGSPQRIGSPSRRHYSDSQNDRAIDSEMKIPKLTIRMRRSPDLEEQMYEILGGNEVSVRKGKKKKSKFKNKNGRRAKLEINQSKAGFATNNFYNDAEAEGTPLKRRIRLKFGDNSIDIDACVPPSKRQKLY